jgi:hypothetical protein
MKLIFLITIILTTIVAISPANTYQKSVLFPNLFKHYLFQNFNTTTNYLNLIQDYQLNIIKHRNYECFFNNYKSYDKFKIDFTSINQTYLSDLWKNYLEDESLFNNATDNFISYFNTTVSFKLSSATF